jgi:translation initiation factor IF-3
MLKLSHLRYLINVHGLSLKPKTFSSLFQTKSSLTPFSNRTYQLNQVEWSSEYKTPTNNSKTFKPSTIAVTNANKHLEINLFDQNDTFLGKMSMEKAKEMANKKELKLVVVDDKESPPKFKLMTGNQLYKSQMTTKETIKVPKSKEIDINLGISDHDLDTKIKMLHNFHEKGHLVTIKIISKIINKKVNSWINLELILRVNCFFFL